MIDYKDGAKQRVENVEPVTFFGTISRYLVLPDEDGCYRPIAYFNSDKGNKSVLIFFRDILEKLKSNSFAQLSATTTTSTVAGSSSSSTSGGSSSSAQAKEEKTETKEETNSLQSNSGVPLSATTTTSIITSSNSSFASGHSFSFFATSSNATSRHSSSAGTQNVEVRNGDNLPAVRPRVTLAAYQSYRAGQQRNQEGNQTRACLVM